MRSLSEIYTSIVNRFKSKTNLDIAKGSVLDSYILSASEALQEAHMEIENNKTPHIYTGLTGDRLDGLGMLVGCPRIGGEEDAVYKSRIINWNTSNQTGNRIAIESALTNLKYSSNATFVALTQGVGTGSIYIIPKELTENKIKLAIEEVKDKVKNVISSTSYVEYVIPELLPIEIVVYASIIKDEINTKENIEKKFEKYINGIAPGDSLKVGDLNKIGINELNIGYFSVSNILVNGKESHELEVLQKLESKLVFDKINWNLVVG